MQVAPDVARKLLDTVAENPDVQIEIDVQARRVRTADGTVDAPFELDDFTQWRLLEGLDDIGLTMRHDDKIAAHESKRQGWLPSTA